MRSLDIMWYQVDLELPRRVFSSLAEHWTFENKKVNEGFSHGAVDSLPGDGEITSIANKNRRTHPTVHQLQPSSSYQNKYQSPFCQETFWALLRNRLQASEVSDYPSSSHHRTGKYAALSPVPDFRLYALPKVSS